MERHPPAPTLLSKHKLTEDQVAGLSPSHPVDGTDGLWPLRRFRGCDRYRRVYAVRRLRSGFRHAGAGLDRC